jgi:hypothetical protein
MLRAARGRRLGVQRKPQGQMPLEHARLRAVEALGSLQLAQSTAAPSNLKVELTCNALQTVRDLLMIQGEELSPLPQGRTAALQFLAHDLPTLILALEVTAVRAETLLKLHDGDGAQGSGAKKQRADDGGPG